MKIIFKFILRVSLEIIFCFFNFLYIILKKIKYAKIESLLFETLKLEIFHEIYLYNHDSMIQLFLNKNWKVDYIYIYIYSLKNQGRKFNFEKISMHHYRFLEAIEQILLTWKTTIFPITPSLYPRQSKLK